MEWNEVSIEKQERKDATIVKFNEAGDEFVGKYVELVSYEKDGEENHFWKFIGAYPDDAEEEFILFPSSVLNTKMARVPLDAIVKIVFLGSKPSEKNKAYNYKDFNIYIAAGE